MKESLLGKIDVYFRAPLVILFVGLFSRSYLIPRSNTDTSNSSNMEGKITDYWLVNEESIFS